MKQKLSLLFLICILSALNINATVYSGSCGTNVRYSLDTSTGVLNITGTGAMTNYSYSSSAPWYSKQSYFKTVEISDGVTSIGNYAFRACSGLTSIEIPNSVTSIGGYAFFWCSGLTSVTIPNSVTSIGSEAFRGCSGLTSIEIPNSVTSIGNSAFSGCSRLTSIFIPNSVTSIGDNAFFWCSGLTKVTFNSNAIASKSYSYDSISTLGSIFGDQVKEFILGNEVTAIGSYAFYKCSGLTSVTIPNSVTSIGEGAFEGCSGLTSVTIPNSVIAVSNKAFYNTNLSTLIVGLGVLSLGSNAFSTKPIKTIWLTNTPPQNYTNAQGTVNYVANNNYTSLSNKTVYPFLSSMFVVDGIRYVPVSPSERTCDAIDCVYNESAEKINIGEKVTNKGISLTVKQVCPYTCYKNTFIKDVNLSFTGDLGNDAFSGCTSLYSAIISNQGNIGEKAFYGCATKNPATFIINNKGAIGTSAFEGCTQMTTAELGKDISSVGNNAFSGCSKLESIEIPDAVTSIGTYSFSNCSSLNFAKIGSGIKAIPSNTFSGCSSLKDVQIGKNVTSIGEYAFSGCSTLPKIQIPQSVTSIANNAFQGCSGLKTMIMDNGDSDLSLSSNGSNPMFADCPLDSVYIGRNITYNTSSSYGYSPFYRNTSLRTVVITDKETEISDNEFYGCTNLQNFKVGDGVTKFGKYAFSGCSSLKSLSFGAQLQSIGQEAFSDCNAVTTIVSKATTPPVCGSQALDDVNKWDCVLYVPEGTISTYQAANQWKEFFFIEEGDPFAVLRGDANGDGKVNMDDATFVTNIILGTEEATEAADVNNDGTVSMPDAMFIVNKILNGKFPDE